MAKMNQKGRTKSSSAFVMLLHHIMDSPAYRSLRPPARVVYLEILRRFKGHNNGDIPLSCREAGHLCNISNATAARAFKELQERGFIKVGRPSGFNMKTRMSTRWILTNQPIEGGIAPTNEWRDWGKNKNTVSPKAQTVSPETP